MKDTISKAEQQIRMKIKELKLALKHLLEIKRNKEQEVR